MGEACKSRTRCWAEMRRNKEKKGEKARDAHSVHVRHMRGDGITL